MTFLHQAFDICRLTNMHTYSHTDRQTDRHDRNYIPPRFEGGREQNSDAGQRELSGDVNTTTKAVRCTNSRRVINFAASVVCDYIDVLSFKQLTSCNYTYVIAASTPGSDISQVIISTVGIYCEVELHHLKLTYFTVHSADAAPATSTW